MTRFAVLLCIFLLTAGCMRSATPVDEYCDAMQVGASVRRIQVQNLYVFGDYRHGVRAFKKSCPSPLAKVRIIQDDSNDPSSDEDKRVKDFLTKILLMPKTNGGLFKLDGIISTGPSGVVALEDVSRFQEVGQADKDEAFRMLPQG